ncbi:unnamed protein product [Effrenium voratum]|uniref:Uncharacterized protein n=1 Tax=Effrenium voratum TaxID=2562239 RepID=A0AA36JCY2_9DINO|nr:unnamed protein product [Effrenium voratum]
MVAALAHCVIWPWARANWSEQRAPSVEKAKNTRRGSEYGVSSAGLRAFFPRTISGDKSETFEERRMRPRHSSLGIRSLLWSPAGT